MLVAVFVMGIVMNHINREYSSIDTENLCLLKE
jgi:hydrogenase-4 component E